MARALKDRLTEQQRRFVQEYAKRPHGTKAAIAAGYSKKSAAAQASQLLKNPKINAALRRIQRISAANNQVYADRVIRELAAVAFGNIGDVVTFGAGGVQLRDSKKLKRRVTSAIGSVASTYSKEGDLQIKVQMQPKVSALMGLARILGIDKDNLSTEHEDDDKFGSWADMVNGHYLRGGTKDE